MCIVSIQSSILVDYLDSSFPLGLAIVNLAIAQTQGAGTTWPQQHSPQVRKPADTGNDARNVAQLLVRRSLQDHVYPVLGKKIASKYIRTRKRDKGEKREVEAAIEERQKRSFLKTYIRKSDGETEEEASGAVASAVWTSSATSMEPEIVDKDVRQVDVGPSYSCDSNRRDKVCASALARKEDRSRRE